MLHGYVARGVRFLEPDTDEIEEKIERIFAVGFSRSVEELGQLERKHPLLLCVLQEFQFKPN